MSDDDRAPPDPTAQPDPGEFNYRPLLEALREVRIRIGEMMTSVGRRTQLYIESEKLLDQIDTVARMTRMPAAVKFVRRKPKDQGSV
jgi:hypothetical protein